MRTPVDTLEQHGVHLLAQLLDRVDELDAPPILQLRGELVDPRAAGFDVGAAALERGDHARARHVIGVAPVVEELRECRHVGGVGADDADSDFGRLRGRGVRCAAPGSKR